MGERGKKVEGLFAICEDCNAEVSVLRDDGTLKLAPHKRWGLGSVRRRIARTMVKCEPRGDVATMARAWLTRLEKLRENAQYDVVHTRKLLAAREVENANAYQRANAAIAALLNAGIDPAPKTEASEKVLTGEGKAK